MATIIYSAKLTDIEGGRLTDQALKETFREAITIHKRLVAFQSKVAYFFIDPLLNNFKAANEFYFSVFECDTVAKINTYRSGAAPIQALADAKELIDGGIYDAVFIFAKEPLLTNRQVYGKEKIAEAMSIFESHSILQCYNELAHTLCQELELSKGEMTDLFDLLFKNYCKTYGRTSPFTNTVERGRWLDDLGGDLFKLTDCANPLIDFAGGVIVSNPMTASLLAVSEKDKIPLVSAKYTMVEGSPQKIKEIVGSKGNLFPHLRTAFLQAQTEGKLNIAKEYKSENLLLDVYTCYPPIPIAFLLASGIIGNIQHLPKLVEQVELTITGGMNLARAPWNSPALNGVIEMYQRLRTGIAAYGLVHGNGGIGETQGIALLQRC